MNQFWLHLRVWSGVGHGQETRLGVLELEVLIRELLAVDGLAASALVYDQYMMLKSL